MSVTLPYWPAALRLDQAAAYCGLSVDTFKEVCRVRPIKFTDHARGQRWLRASLDTWLSQIDPNQLDTISPCKAGFSFASSKRRIGDRIGGERQAQGS